MFKLKKNHGLSKNEIKLLQHNKQIDKLENEIEKVGLYPKTFNNNENDIWEKNTSLGMWTNKKKEICTGFDLRGLNIKKTPCNEGTLTIIEKKIIETRKVNLNHSDKKKIKKKKEKEITKKVTLYTIKGYRNLRKICSIWQKINALNSWV